MYLHQNRFDVWIYRRPVTQADQVFWRGPQGGVKKEWSKSLDVKDKKIALDRWAAAHTAYDVERMEQYRAWLASGGGTEANQLPVSSREVEEQAAAAKVEADRKARHIARRELRVLHRERMNLSTMELAPEEAAWRDLVRERDQDLAALRAAVAGQAKVNAVIAEEMGKPIPRASNKEGRTVEKLIMAYERDKSASWSGSTKKAVQPVFRLLREVFPGRFLDSITRDDARGLVETLKVLPTQIGKRKELAGLTIPQAVERGQELGLATIQPKTINDGYLLHVASMFNWAVREQWLASTPFRGLSVFDPVDDEDRRDPFTKSQLTTLFSAPPWDRPWSAGRVSAASYWVPLLCLFHGFRNAEAAGLRVEDVEEEEDISLIRIRPYNRRTLKNQAARGTIPVHPELERLGFLDFVVERQNADADLLFVEGVANSRGQVGAKLGERFSKHIKRLGLVGQKLGTHSFRHCFEDRIREAELVERTATALSRRVEPGSGRVYGHGLSARLKREAIAKITYPGLDLTHLYPPEHVNDLAVRRAEGLAAL